MRQRDFDRMWKKMPAFALSFFGALLIFYGSFSVAYDLMEILGSIALLIGSVMFISGIIWGIVRLKNKKEIKNNLVNSKIEEVDSMNGIQFENFLDSIFTYLGYKVKHTRTTGDFGADLILQNDTERIIVQAKRYSKKVSVSAVQEISAARNYYSVQNAWVVTNNYFTNPAIKLANANGVRLINREDLSALMIKAKNKKEDVRHGDGRNQKVS